MALYITPEPDFDPLTVPAVMPQSVRRANDQGLPTQWQLDYEQALQAWMKQNVANTNTRMTRVFEELDGNYAAIVTETNARVTADEALAETITSVEAKFDEQLAYGEVYLRAKATPTGAIASYGVFLKAGDAFTGLEMAAATGGGSFIGLAADKFWIYAPSARTRILDYAGGEWTLNGNVTVNGNLVVNGTINTEKAVNSAFTQAYGSRSGGTYTSVGLVTRSGASVQVIASFDGRSGIYYGLGTQPGQLIIYRDGSQIAAVNTPYEGSGSGSSAGISIQPVTTIAVDNPPAGYHTYEAYTSNGPGIGGVAVVAFESAR